MIGGARTMTAAVGHGKKAARRIDAWLRGGTYHKPPASNRSSTSNRSTCPCSSMPTGGEQAKFPVANAWVSTKSWPGSRRRRRATKPAAASRAAIASNATTATHRVRSRRSSSSARDVSTATTTICVPAAPCVSSSARATRSRWTPSRRRACRRVAPLRHADEIQGPSIHPR